MAYDFGDVVLAPFPFTDQSGLKKRPAVIVSKRNYNDARREWPSPVNNALLPPMAISY